MMPDTQDSGWREEFTAFFAARHQHARRTAYLLCGDWHWADDLAQVAFVRLAAAWDRVREPAALDAFLRTCLVRAYLAEAGRAWRRREASVADLPDAAPRSGRDESGEAVDQTVFMAALRRVPPRQRATLVCRFYQGLDVAETAAVLRCSVGAVKSQTSRGLTALRAVLGKSITVDAMVEVER
jgi:RNA polymerase sigma-70 factor (sigma-E family)